MAGFEFRYMLNGGFPVYKEFYAKDTETLTVGDMMNIETGECDLGATGDTGFAGMLASAVDPDAQRNSSHEWTPGVITAVDSTTRLRVLISPDAVYSTTDANARNAGATLDISGATGAQGLAASSNTEFVVVETKLAAADPTFVIFAISSHYLAKAQ